MRLVTLTIDVTATRCRNYLNEVVGIGTENHNEKNGLYVCTAAGWVVGKVSVTYIIRDVPLHCYNV